MMRDLRLLLWLRWRHLRGRSQWWLFILGVDTEKRSLTETLYGLYLGVILAGWFVLMMAWAANGAFSAGAAAGGAGLSALTQAATLLPFALLAAFAVRALRSSPVKLTFPDTAYVAGSTLDSRAIASSDWAREAIMAAALSAALGYLAGALAFGAGATASAPVTAAGVTALTAVAMHALGWAIGLARMARRPRPWPTLIWVLPIPVAALVLLVPSALRWPGTALATGLLGEEVALHALGLAALAVVGVAMLMRVARRLDMTAVTDESVLFAQLAVFRPMMMYDANAYRDIVRRKKLATKHPRLALAEWSGPWAIVARALISHARQPSTLLWPLIWGVGFLPLAASVALSPTGVLAYLAVLFAVLVAPARQLIHAFGDDIDRPSMRESLPFGNVALLALDTAPAFACMALGAVATGLATGGGGHLVAAISLSLLLAIIVVLCRALERLTLPSMQHPIGSGISLLVCLVAIFFAGASSPIAACATAAVAVGILGSMVEAGRL
ncbi:MAG: hypothetical protein HGA39_02220 [Coriobacteriia bacterium]|nr:hypothetical protein [Coriobacteriia bacterium]